MNGHEKIKERSERMLTDALITLMKEKDYSQITVSEIAKRADISRRTFYRLYENKEDMLYSHFSELCRLYKSECTELENYDIRRIAQEYFGFWHRQKDFLLLLYRNRLDAVMYYGIYDAASEIVRYRIQNRAKKDPELEFFIRYTVGGFGNLLFQWIIDGMEEEPEEYAGLVGESILKYIQPAVNA